MNKINYIDIILRSPNILDDKQIMEMQREFFATHCKFNGTCNLNLFNNYVEWLAHTINQTHGTEFNNNPSSTKHTYLVTNSQNALLGMVEIIFFYDYETANRCAHIVECIRPIYRRQGLGKPLLKKAIHECNSFGICKQNITTECNSKACNDTMTKIINF